MNGDAETDRAFDMDDPDDEREAQETAARMKRDVKLVEAHVAQIREHFDSVQIFAVRHQGEGDATESVRLGGGCWHARYGVVREWLIQKDAEARRGASC